ncbi:MAG: universal stress protein [Ilumatobacteraceae bacterium]
MGPIVVGIDGSANAQRAVAVAADLAQRFDTELVVLHAVGLMSVVDGEHVASDGHRDEIERVAREQWCGPLADSRSRDEALRWELRLVDGSPSDVLLKSGRDLDASYLVVGSRGAGSEQLLGSTSHHVVQHCDRPVVVVPPLDRS